MTEYWVDIRTPVTEYFTRDVDEQFRMKVHTSKSKLFATIGHVPLSVTLEINKISLLFININ